jgi:PRC-barrel domain
MTAPIEDVSSLPGRKVTDQEENPIGKIKEIYAIDGDGHPMWVTVEASFGMGNKRIVFIPLARLKDEDGELRVPYSKGHIEQTPEVDGSDGISAECDRQLRDHYGIDTGDQEMRSDNNSYATLVPEGEGTAKLAEDPDQLETPNADRRDDDTKERLHNPGSSDTRDVDAGAIADENASNSGSGDKADEGSGEDKRANADENGEESREKDREKDRAESS